MSQVYKGGVSSTPSVPTSFTTDQTDTTTTSFPAAVGAAVPQANILRVTGVNGIQTFQPTLVPGVLEIGYNEGSVTTVGAVTSTILTISPTNNSAQTYQFLIAGYDSANGLAIGGQLLGVCRNVAGTLTVLATPDRFFDSDAALNTGSFNMVASGATLLVQVIGVAGHTIDWTVINAAGVVTAT